MSRQVGTAGMVPGGIACLDGASLANYHISFSQPAHRTLRPDCFSLHIIPEGQIASRLHIIPEGQIGSGGKEKWKCQTEEGKRV